MNGKNIQYVNQKPRSIGKPTTRQSQTMLRVDLTPKKKIQIQVNKLNKKINENMVGVIPTITSPHSQQNIPNHQIPSSTQPSVQFQLQCIVSKYEKKLKTMNEEFEKVKSELQNKIHSLSKEKKHWQGVANKLSQASTQQQKSFQKTEQEKDKTLINKLMKENSLLGIQKQNFKKEVKAIKQENEKLAHQIRHLHKEISRFNQAQAPGNMRNRSKSPRMYSKSHHGHTSQSSLQHRSGSQTSSHSRMSTSNPLELGKTQNECENLKHLVRELNKQIINSKLQGLNNKYFRHNQTTVKFY